MSLLSRHVRSHLVLSLGSRAYVMEADVCSWQRGKCLTVLELEVRLNFLNRSDLATFRRRLYRRPSSRATRQMPADNLVW
jgi:hypothetical protein